MKTRIAGLIVLILLVGIAVSQPPEPRNINGFVFGESGSGMPNGIPVLINNTANGDTSETEVYAPPIPQLAGAYSTTITGNIGDIIFGYAWNSTSYGFTQAILDTTTEINITMNLTRGPETNVTIVGPPNGSSFTELVDFNVTVNVSILGADGSCNITISFSNSTVMNVSSGENYTHHLGNVTSGGNYNTTFSVAGIGSGTSDITAAGFCSPPSPAFEVQTSDTISVTILDSGPPVVQLISPPNNTEIIDDNNVTFEYNVSDGSPITSCSLIIDGSVNKTDTSVTRDATQNFTSVIQNGNYEWGVNCTDNSAQTGSSPLFNLTMSVFFPEVSEMSVSQDVILNAGSTKRVECNFTVSDGNGVGDIASHSSVFFYSGNQSTDSDNPNEHYTNSSCSESSGSNSINYTCTYQVLYHAINGTWYCNATATDLQGLTGTNVTNTTIEPLFALNTSSDVIDYGNLQIEDTSPERIVNITNIGNQPIDVSFRGFGGQDSSTGDGFAMLCAANNITIGNQRYSQTSSAFGSKTQLTSTPTSAGWTIPKQTSSLVVQSSYWQIFVPNTDPPLGRSACNGTIIFQAEST